MSSENRVKILKFYQRASEEVRTKVREILGGEPSKELLKSAAPEKIDQALALLSGLKGPSQTPPKEYLTIQAYWDRQLATFFGQRLRPDVLEAITRMTRAENIGNAGVSSSIKESKWDIYTLLTEKLERKTFHPEIADFCGLSEWDVNQRSEMLAYGVKNEGELKQIKAFEKFFVALPPEDKLLVKEIIEATWEAEKGMWWTVMDLSDEGRFRRAKILASRLAELGFERVPSKGNRW